MTKAKKFNQDNVIKVVHSVVARTFALGNGPVAANTDLREEYGMDSLDVLCIWSEIAAKLSMSKKQEDLFYDAMEKGYVSTVGHIVVAACNAMQLQPSEEVQQKNNDFRVSLFSDVYGKFRLTGKPISFDDGKKLIDAVQDTPMSLATCWQSVGIKANLTMHRGASVLGTETGVNDIYVYPVYGVPGCFCENNMKSKVGISKLAMCAKNLSMGKCQDEFMRQTIGAVLFPQFYANNKQK